MRQWLARKLIEWGLRLGRPRVVRVDLSRRLMVAVPEGGNPFVADADTGEPLLAPPGTSYHMMIRPGEGEAHLALVFDDPLARAAVGYGSVPLVNATPAPGGGPTCLAS